MKKWMSPNYHLYQHYLHPQRVRKTKLSGELAFLSNCVVCMLCNRNELKPAYDVESGIESVEDACSHHHGNLATCHFFLAVSNFRAVFECVIVNVCFNLFLILF